MLEWHPCSGKNECSWNYREQSTQHHESGAGGEQGSGRLGQVKPRKIENWTEKAWGR